jgi:hypothetical protein
VRSFSTPANLLPRTENGTLWYASNDDPETLTGRQSNRGYEGASTNALRLQCMLAEREARSVSCVQPLYLGSCVRNRMSCD